MRKEVKSLEKKTENFLARIGENGKPLLFRPVKNIKLRDDLLNLSGALEKEAKEMRNSASKKSIMNYNERVLHCIEKINTWDKEQADKRRSTILREFF